MSGKKASGERCLEGAPASQPLSQPRPAPPCPRPRPPSPRNLSGPARLHLKGCAAPPGTLNGARPAALLDLATFA